VESQLKPQLLDANALLFQPDRTEEFAAFVKGMREQFAKLLTFVPVKPD
jgi:hypothetical protein